MNTVDKQAEKCYLIPGVSVRDFGLCLFVPLQDHSGSGGFFN